MTREERIAALMTAGGMTLSVAESCTGGCLAHHITSVPGSSAFFLYGIIAYSDTAKTRLLAVPADLIARHGAVSEPVAEAMARGVRRIGPTDIGVGITGIAGPDGGTKRRPVGLVFIAVATADEVLCLRCLFQGDRRRIKQQASTQALKLIEEFASG